MKPCCSARDFKSACCEIKKCPISLCKIRSYSINLFRKVNPSVLTYEQTYYTHKYIYHNALFIEKSAPELLPTASSINTFYIIYTVFNRRVKNFNHKRY